jgi:hypothetical protein
VASAGCERSGAPYGCQLIADERLFAVMYWSWNRRLRTRQQLRAHHEAYLATLRKQISSDSSSRFGLDGSVRMPAAAEFGLGSVASKFTLGELVSPTAFGAVRALETYTASTRAITKLFENPLSGLMANLDQMNSMARTVENIRALTDSITVSPAISTALGTSVALPHIDTSVAAVVTGKPFKHLTKLTSAEVTLPWTIPSGVAEMVGGAYLNSNTLASLTHLRVPPVAELIGITSHISTAIEAFRNIERLGQPLREMAGGRRAD